jgi:hypothetical protein
VRHARATSARPSRRDFHAHGVLDLSAHDPPLLPRNRALSARRSLDQCTRRPRSHRSPARGLDRGRAPRAGALLRLTQRWRACRRSSGAARCGRITAFGDPPRAGRLGPNPSARPVLDGETILAANRPAASSAARVPRARDPRQLPRGQAPLASRRAPYGCLSGRTCRGTVDRTAAPWRRLSAAA